MSIDQEKVEQFVGQLVGDVGATVSSALAHLGHRLGLYGAMAASGPLTPAELARRTGTHERYVREWLNNQVAGGYLVYDPTGGTYELPPEHAFVLANEDSPLYMASARRSEETTEPTSTSNAARRVRCWPVGPPGGRCLPSRADGPRTCSHGGLRRIPWSHR